MPSLFSKMAQEMMDSKFIGHGLGILKMACLSLINNFLVSVKKIKCTMKIESGCSRLWETLHYQKRENLLLMPLRFLALRDHHMSA